MTTLLLPLSSAHSLLPPVVLFGVAPHYYFASSVLRLLKCVLPRRLYERIDHFMYHSYQSLVTYFFETYSGNKVYFYGAKFPTDKNENVLYISNHQSSIDWSLADLLAIRQNSIGQVRYVIKDILKYIPFFGWYFVQHGCIFVERNGKITEEELRSRWRTFAKDRKLGYWLVIFPEGTRYTSKKQKLIEKSKEIARQEGYEPLENVLFPRTKAIEITLSELNDLDAVYNLTLAFNVPWLPLKSKQEGPSLFEFVSVYGREVHINFERIPVTALPKDAEGRKKWLFEKFQEKDKLLDYFYNPTNGRQFPGDKYTLPLKGHQIYPYAYFYSGLLLISLATARGRSLYFESWKFGFASWLLWSLYFKFFRN